MQAEGAGTKVDVVTDLSITGKVAQFGRGVLGDVSSKLMGQFVENLERDVLTTARRRRHVARGRSLRTGARDRVPGPCRHATLRPGPRRRADRARSHSREVEPVDLFEVAGASVTKRLVPVGIGALVLFVLWRILRGRD